MCKICNILVKTNTSGERAGHEGMGRKVCRKSTSGKQPHDIASKENTFNTEGNTETNIFSKDK